MHCVLNNLNRRAEGSGQNKDIFLRIIPKYRGGAGIPKLPKMCVFGHKKTTKDASASKREVYKK